MAEVHVRVALVENVHKDGLLPKRLGTARKVAARAHEKSRELEDGREPALDAWRTLCDVDEGGALLVRPDHHVAWRARGAAQTPGLARALDVIAGRVREQDDRDETETTLTQGENLADGGSTHAHPRPSRKGHDVC